MKLLNMSVWRRRTDGGFFKMTLKRGRGRVSEVGLSSKVMVQIFKLFVRNENPLKVMRKFYLNLMKII